MNISKTRNFFQSLEKKLLFSQKRL